MADNTQTTMQAGPRVEIPILQTPEEIFNAIMGLIEPELTTTQAPLLKEKYKDETPEQRKKRNERYKAACQEYDKQFAAFSFAIQEKSRAFAINAVRDVESTNREKEVSQLRDIESSLSSTA